MGWILAESQGMGRRERAHVMWLSEAALKAAIDKNRSSKKDLDFFF